jgi:hypothetical protein
MVHAALLAPQQQPQQQAHQSDAAAAVLPDSSEKDLLNDPQAMEIEASASESLPATFATPASVRGSGRSSPAWSISDEDDVEMAD